MNTLSRAQRIEAVRSAVRLYGSDIVEAKIGTPGSNPGEMFSVACKGYMTPTLVYLVFAFPYETITGGFTTGIRGFYVEGAEFDPDDAAWTFWHDGLECRLETALAVTKRVADYLASLRGSPDLMARGRVRALRHIAGVVGSEEIK